MDINKITELINRYENIRNELQDPKAKEKSNYQELYKESVYLSSTLRDIVLTGSELVEKGIVKKIKESEIAGDFIGGYKKKDKFIEVYKKVSKN